jgi:hypothetical protein
MGFDPYAGRSAAGDEPDRREDDTLNETGQVPGRAPASTPPIYPKFAAEAEPEIQPRIVRQPPRQRSCLLPALGLGLIAVGLLIVGLFLPPISLWDTLTGSESGGDAVDEPGASVPVETFTLNAASSRLERDGLIVEAAPDALAADYRVQVASLDPAGYLAQTVPASGWYCDPDLPEGHALASRVYSLAQGGTAPAALTLQVTALDEIPPDAKQPLRLFQWNADTRRWEYLPDQTSLTPGVQSVDVAVLPRCVALFRLPESARDVGLLVAPGQTYNPALTPAHVQIYPAGLRPTVSGALQGVLAAGIDAGQGYDVLPLIRNYDDPAVIDVATVQALLADPALRAEHARQIAAFALREDAGYVGVMLDYREIPADQRDSYTAFLRELADLLHSQDRVLVVALPAPVLDAETQGFDGGAYDWAAIGHAADAVVLDLPLSPSVVVPDGMADRLIDWAARQVSPAALWLGTSALSVEEQGSLAVTVASENPASDLGAQVQFDAQEAVAPGEPVTVRLVSADGSPLDVGADEVTGAAYLRVLDADGAPLRTLWITTPAALSARLNRAAEAGLAGVFVRDVYAAGVMPGTGDALLDYQTHDPGITVLEALVYTIEGGEIVDQAGGVVTVAADPGAPSITVEARIGDLLVASGSIPVAVVPTATPTLPPTATPAPTTQAAPTTAPAIPTPTDVPVTPAPQAGGPVEPVADLTIPTVDPALLAGVTPASGEYEVGVTLREMNATTILATGRAHFNWMAVHVTHQPGLDPAALQTTINNAQGNGFKILLSVSGDAAALAADPAGYMGQYAQYVGGLAALDVEGIEIWPEMNGAAQIAPEAYAQILGLSYSAIKTANPAVLVILGGPASIAAGQQDTAYTWTTGTTYDALASAGAGQYADCIGVHYTLGAVAPDATGGDVRGSEPVYFLPALLDLATGAFPGRALCVTRLGYLSPEGAGTLPDGYGWAQMTTAAQQAQWLASAVQVLAARGDVRLAVLWAMDGTGLDAPDLAGGYALQRPDGSCPACDALEPVLK